jgi:hypothetical protein
MSESLRGVLRAVANERAAQDAKWGEQNHPDGTGPDVIWLVDRTEQGAIYVANMDAAQAARFFREACQETFARGQGTWLHVLLEEVAEAFECDDPVRLRAELIQIAAVCVSWAQSIDRRPTNA